MNNIEAAMVNEQTRQMIEVREQLAAAEERAERAERERDEREQAARELLIELGAPDLIDEGRRLQKMLVERFRDDYPWLTEPEGE